MRGIIKPKITAKIAAKPFIEISNGLKAKSEITYPIGIDTRKLISNPSAIPGNEKESD